MPRKRSPRKNYGSTLIRTHVQQPIKNRNKLNAVFGATRSVCSLLPPKIWSMVHHKTGHDISWSIGGVLKKYCHKKMNMITELSINKFVSSCGPQNCVYMHWVRHPLNTIISGYYYHLKTDEEWVHDWKIKTSINTAIDMETDLLYMDILNNRIDDHKYYSKYRKEIVIKVPGMIKKRHKAKMDYKRKRLSKLTTCFDIGSKSSILYEYISEFIDEHIKINMSYVLMNNIDITLQKYYQKLQQMDYRIGLFWEMIRYFNCEWASIYVLQQIGYKYWNNIVEYDIDELTHGEFNDNMNKLLDQLGIIDDDIHRKKMKDNVNITKQRINLLGYLNELDVTKTNKERTEHVNMHITHNEYDIEQVTHDLLGFDIQICKLIKNMTLLLKFEWG
eukprot:529106_1